MTKQHAKQDALNLQDLLLDEKTNELSQYLSVSIENLGVDTRVSVTTIEDNPITYSSTLNGVSINDLQVLVDSNTETVF